MSFSLSGLVITQSGTDTSLAGLAGISGVTTRIINQGGPYAPNRIVYILNNVRLSITGTLTISPRFEALEFGNFAVLPELTIESGGTLNVEEQSGNSPNIVYGNNEWLRVQYTRTSSTPSWSEAGIALGNNGTFNWRGGKIFVPNFTNFGTLNIDYGIIEGIPFELATLAYANIKSGTINISRIAIGNTFFITFATQENATISGIELTSFSGGVLSDALNGGSFTNVITVIDPPSSTTTGFLFNAIRGARITGINVPTGSGAIFNIQNDGGGEANALNTRIEVQKRISFSALTLARNPISDVHFFTRDTNNGLRTDRTRDSYTADRTYVITTDANGTTPQQSVLTAVAYTNSIEALGSMPITVDRRGVGNSTEDIFRWVGWGYNYLLADLNTLMKGNGDALVEVTLFNDSAVTLSATAAAALTSISTLNDVYDAAKLWKCQPEVGRLEYPSVETQPINANGTSLDLGNRNIVIDALAASTFAINTSTNTITIKSTTLMTSSKFVELQTTGTINFANGSATSARLSGILTYSTPGTVTQSLGTATLRFSTAGTYNLRGANILGTVTLENTSGGAVTVQLQPEITFVNNGPNITVDNPIISNVSITGITPGSRLQIYNVTTATEIVNTVVAGTTYSATYEEGTGYSQGDTVRVRLAYQNGTTAKLPFSAQAVVGTSGWSILAAQQDDAVYSSLGIDGATITEFTPDFPNVEVDISDPDGTTRVDRLYAWFVHTQASDEDGIRLWFNGIVPEDDANFRIITSILDLKIDNTAATGVTFIDGRRLYRDDNASPLVQSTSGGGSITLFAGKVYTSIVSTTLPVITGDIADVPQAVQSGMTSQGYTEEKINSIQNNTNLIPATL